MKILHIVKKLDIGGIENMLLLSLPLFRKHGIETDILCIRGGFLDEKFISEGAHLIDFGKFRYPFLDAAKLYKVIKTGNYDVVHAQSAYTAGFLAFVCKILNVRFIVSVHNQKSGFLPSWENTFFMSWVRSLYLALHRKMTLKYSSRILGHSKINLGFFAKKIEEGSRFTVIKNGIDFSKLNKNVPLSEEKDKVLKAFLKDRPFVIAHIGSFRKQKNHRFLIEVFKNLKPVENSYKLILMSDGVEFNNIRHLVKDVGLEDHVLFTGIETNIFQYISEANMFFFPSLYEGFGNVLIEAQYAKLPICASDIEPHYESVCQVYHQYFFNPTDVIDAETKITKMINLIRNGELKNSIKQASLFAEEYSLINMVAEMVKLYSADNAVRM